MHCAVTVVWPLHKLHAYLGAGGARWGLWEGDGKLGGAARGEYDEAQLAKLIPTPPDPTLHAGA